MCDKKLDTVIITSMTSPAEDYGPAGEGSGRVMIRERGIPKSINRTALGAMMARGPLQNGIVLFPRCGPSP